MSSTGMYLHSQPAYLVLQDPDGGAFHAADTQITREHLQEVLRRISQTDVTLSDLHLASTWTVRARQATTHRNGRVLLAGDAAHIHAPLGARDSTSGLDDAMNLGGKLAATVHATEQDNALEGLLDTYQTERHPLGAAVLDWSRAQAAIMKPQPVARALNAILRDLIETRDGATYIAGRLWGVTTHYNFDSDHPLAGHSAPTFDFEDGTSMDKPLHDGQGILLDFQTTAFLKTLASDYSNLKYMAGRAKE